MMSFNKLYIDVQEASKLKGVHQIKFNVGVNIRWDFWPPLR